MNFLNPAVLFGLIAASIPLILHLLHLRKLRTVEFSSLKFLKELQKTKIRRLKLKQILLLILRTLLIIFLILAFSRPTIKSSLPLVGTYSKTSTVILFDNSFSMDVSDEFGNRFIQAKNAANTLINSMKDGDEFAILPIADLNGNFNKSLSRNKSIVYDELQKIKISNITGNIDNNLRVAERILSESNNLNREIYIISDVQPNIFFREFKDSLKILDSYSSVFVVPIGSNSKQSIQNLSVDSLNVITKIIQKNKPVEVEAFIKNLSDKSFTGLLISLFLNNERVAQRTIDIQSQETKSITITAEPKSTGIFQARVEIENDALDADNYRYFGFVVPEKPNIAIIGSAEKTKFINLALNTKTTNENFFNTALFSPEQFNQIDLKNFDMVIVAGGPYRESDFNKLSNYVQNGNSVFVFADQNTEFSVLKKGLSYLNITDFNASEAPKEQNYIFNSVDKLHPIFEGVFKGTTDNKTIVESPKIKKFYPSNSGQVIINTSVGGFLTEIKNGEGRVIYCSTPPDLESSNFPVTGLFPALLYRSIFYLSAKQTLSVNSIPGNNLSLKLPKNLSNEMNLKLTDPKGKEFFKQAVKMPSGNTLLLDNMNQTGIYTLYSENGIPAGVIAVNPEKSESYLSPLNTENIKTSLYGRINKNVPITIINPVNLNSNIQRARTGTELWQLFIILGIICALTEMILSKTLKKEIIE